MLQRLKFDGMRGDIRHIEPRQDLLGRLGVVVGGAAHEAEAHQRRHRVDGGPPVLEEESFDRGPRVETGGEHREHPQSARFERRDHPVVMAGVARQNIGAHHQQAHGRLDRPIMRRQLVQRLGDAAGHAGVIDADFGVFGRRQSLHRAAQPPSRPVRVAIDQRAHEVGHVLFGAGQPILQRQEIGAHVLRGAGNEAQQLGDAAQHRHLVGAGRRGFFLRAAQLLEQSHRAARRRAHVELAHAGELCHLAGRHRANHGVAVVAPRLQSFEQRLKMLLQEQHHVDDDVGVGDIGQAALQSGGIGGKFGGRVNVQPQTADLFGQRQAGAIRRARDMRVHRDDHDLHGCFLNGRSGLSHRTASRQ